MALNEGDRVLVKDQADTTQNGIYLASSSLWSRALDFDGARDAVDGTLVVVKTATNAFLYQLSSSTTPTVFGTSHLTFALGAFGDSSTVTFLQAGAGAVARSSQDKMRDVVSVSDFGALGDGTTDDTVALQAALNSGNKVVVAVRGKTYLINEKGTLTVNAQSERYCLTLPNGVLFDLNGATLKLGNAQNANMIINATAGGAQGTDLGVINGTFDQNKANQTVPGTGEMACIKMVNTLRLRVEGIVAKNVRQFASRFLQCDRAYFNNLSCLDSDGDGWYFGIDAGLSWQVTNRVHDNIRGENCTGVYTGGGLQGNPAIFTVQYCEIGKIFGKDCNAGFKCQDSSIHSSFGQVTLRGLNNGTANCGMKIQGNGALNPAGISVGQVIVENGFGSGLFITQCTDVTIGSFIGLNNARGLGAGTHDVEIQTGADRISIGSIRSTTCKMTQAVVVTGSGKVQLGQVEIFNPTTVACQISQASPGVCDIDSLTVVDDGGGTTTQVFYVSGAAKGHCRRIYTNLANSLANLRVQIAGGNYDYTIGSFQMGTNPQENIVALAAAGTTAVANDSIIRAYVGGAADYFHPIIQVLPANATAAALGQMRASVADYSGGTGFTLNHSTLATTSALVMWKVLGWKTISAPIA